MMEDMVKEMKMADQSANQSAKKEITFQNDYSTKISPVKEDEAYDYFIPVPVSVYNEGIRALATLENITAIVAGNDGTYVDTALLRDLLGLGRKIKKIMVKLTILKSREEWLKARTRIGGSDASAVVGENPYKSNVDLWLEKTGQAVPEDISDKPYVKYGIAAEPHLRALFAYDYPQYKVVYEENNMFTNDKYPWAHASLDGWLMDADGRMGILEIKTTEILQSMQREKWKNRIPGNYYIQVLHYLMVTEFDYVVLKAQLKSQFGDEEVYLQTRHYRIERSEVQEDIDYLINAEKKFWQQVQERKQPNMILPDINI